jgi:hypothetical protein
MDEGPSYTVDKANAALPELRERLGRIRDARQTMLGAAERIRDRTAADGGGVAGSDYWEASRTLKTEVERLADQGILLRDPETGLVDFPGEREGRRVFLCWRLGEDRVSFWHETDTGFIGRKPL